MRAKYMYLVSLYEAARSTRYPLWFRSQKDMSELYGISDTTISLGLLELEEKGIIEITRDKKTPPDFSDRKALYQFCSEVKKDFGKIDILVNNAGSILRKPAAEHPDEYWDKIIEINQSAQFILTREFGKDMVDRGDGKIIFTASLLTFQGGITVPGYAASKGAVGQLTMAFANEWAAKGVNVNAVAPGYIATDTTVALRADKERNAAILSRIPAGRWGNPEDFKGAVVFLASGASDYVHGTILIVDGGWMGR